MRFDSLDKWLLWQETLHPRSIDLTLDRCVTVAQRLGITATRARQVTIAGTNGKGSSAVMLDAICRAAGCRTGVYTSPHVTCYNERIRINARMVTDEELCAAFDQIDRARGDITLTYFEYGTLAAMLCFSKHDLDVEILEVGLGGRLDAVNIRDADVGLITSIDIDHVEWLGPDRDGIAREKAGIMRAGAPVVIADPDPPASLALAAREAGAVVLQAGRDFDYEAAADGWAWREAGDGRLELPLPSLHGGIQLQNAAGVVAVARQLGRWLDIGDGSIRAGLTQAGLPARWQVVPGPVPLIIDVAHNPAAAAGLAAELGKDPCTGTTRAVFSMLAGKDVAAVVRAMSPVIGAWYVAGLDTGRGLAGEELAETIMELTDGIPVSLHDSVGAALGAARAASVAGDRILAFGSFYTAADVIAEVA